MVYRLGFRVEGGDLKDLPLVAHRRLARSATDPPHLSPNFCSSCFSMSPPISCSCSSPGKLLAPVSASSMSLLSLSFALSLSLSLSLVRTRFPFATPTHSLCGARARACAPSLHACAHGCSYVHWHMYYHTPMYTVSAHTYLLKSTNTHVLAHAYLHTCAPRNADYRLGFRIWGTGHRGWGLGFSWTTG